MSASPAARVLADRRSPAASSSAWRWRARWCASPTLLLADEPFGALDALTRLKMHALLRELCDRHRPAVLLVTHDVDEAIVLADRVLVIDDGRIVARPPASSSRSPAATATRSTPGCAATCSPRSASEPDTRGIPVKHLRLLALLALAAIPLAGCGDDAGGDAAAATNAPLATAVPEGAKITIADDANRLATLMRLSGEHDKLAAEVDYASFSSGPLRLEAIRAGRARSGSRATCRRSLPSSPTPACRSSARSGGSGRV